MVWQKWQWWEPADTWKDFDNNSEEDEKDFERSYLSKTMTSLLHGGVDVTAWLFTLPLENGGIVWETLDGSGLEIRPLWLPTVLPLPWHRISIGAKRYPKRQKSENCWRRWMPTPLWLWFLHYPTVGMKIVVLSPKYSNQQDNFKIISTHSANLNQMNQSLQVGLEYWYCLVLPRWF